MVTVVSMVGLDYSNSVYDDNNEIEFNTIMKRKKHACEIVFVYKKKSEEEYSISWYTASLLQVGLLLLLTGRTVIVLMTVGVEVSSKQFHLIFPCTMRWPVRSFGSFPVFRSQKQIVLVSVNGQQPAVASASRGGC